MQRIASERMALSCPVRLYVVSPSAPYRCVIDSRHVGAVPHQVYRSTASMVPSAAEACKILLLLLGFMCLMYDVTQDSKQTIRVGLDSHAKISGQCVKAFVENVLGVAQNVSNPSTIGGVTSYQCRDTVMFLGHSAFSCLLAGPLVQFQQERYVSVI